MNAKEIILIDDDEATLFYNGIVLENANYNGKVTKFNNAKDALDYLKNTPIENRTKPDAIFLDINMPGLDGWGFLEEYKQLDDELKAKEVIAMLTVSLNPDDRARAKTYKEVSDYLTKPLSESSIHKVLEKLKD